MYFCNGESNLLFTVKEIDEHVGNGLQVVSSALAFPHVGINRHIPEVIIIDIYSTVCTYHPQQCCGSSMFISDPGSDFFHLGSRIESQKYSGSRIRICIKEFKYLNPQKCSKLWEI